MQLSGGTLRGGGGGAHVPNITDRLAHVGGEAKEEGADEVWKPAEVHYMYTPGAALTMWLTP